MKTYTLNFDKVFDSCTYAQLQYLTSFKNVKVNVKSTSQILKRLSKIDASDLIEIAKTGEEIIIK